MSIINHIKTKFFTRRFLWCDNAVLIYLALAKLAIHLLTSKGYGYFVDELYYLDATKHLDFGYVDMPPLIPVLMALSNRVFGVSLVALHILPAVAGAAMVFFAGLLAREMGGGRFAQRLTALIVIAAPIWLILNSWFAYDPFDQLVTVILLYLIVLLLKQEMPRRWVTLGIITGIGIMVKLSMIFMAFAFIAAVLLTSKRKWLISKWPLVAALIAPAICAPFLVWQAVHGWPLIRYWHAYAAIRQQPQLLQTVIEQILYLNPAALIIWVLGLYYLFFHPEGKKYRVFGLMYLVLQLFFIGVIRLQSRMSAVAYFPLFAAGAVLMEQMIASLATRRPGWNWLKPVLIGAILLVGLRIVPYALPVLPAPAMASYVYQQLGVPLPDHFKFQFGWPEMTRKIAAVYRSLPEADRRQCVIYASAYPEAAAIDFFGKDYGLPGAICNHLSYQIWGLGKYSGKVAIAFGFRFSPSKLEEVFEEVEGTKVMIQSKYGISYEQFLPVYICRKPKVPLKEVWNKLEDFF